MFKDWTLVLRCVVIDNFYVRSNQYCVAQQSFDDIIKFSVSQVHGLILQDIYIYLSPFYFSVNSRNEATRACIPNPFYFHYHCILYFEIITDSYAFDKNHTEISHFIQVSNHAIL